MTGRHAVKHPRPQARSVAQCLCAAACMAAWVAAVTLHAPVIFAGAATTWLAVIACIAWRDWRHR